MAVPPPSPGRLPPHPDKGPLRAAMLERRTAHVDAIGEAAARAAADSAAHLLLAHIPPGAIVALYLALHGELDPAPLVQLLAARSQQLAMPRLADDTLMDFRAWSPGDPIERGPFRLRQPLGNAAPLVPHIIVTPLVGFDRGGGRLGHGKSHYDRAFARYPGARRIGFAWSLQECAPLPHDPWDVRLHAVTTENEYIPMADVPA